MPHADLPDDTPIWRYMDLAKFASMMFSRRLWFTKLSELWAADPWEGFGRAKGLKRPSKQAAGASVSMDTMRDLCAEFSGFAAETVRNAPKLVDASSWCAAEESLGMWERYGVGAYGLAVESSVGDFKRALNQTLRREQYLFGPVRYHADLPKASELKHGFRRGRVPASGELWKIALRVGFHKRAFYQDENEWRAAIFQEHPRPEVKGLGAPIDLDVLIRSVRIGPRASRPMIEAAKGILAAAKLVKPIEESGILRRPRLRRSR